MLEDLGEMHAIRTSEAVRKILWDDVVIKRKTAEEPINARIETFASHGFGLWTIIYKRDDKMIGFCGFRFLEGTTGIELLYGILPDYWNRGLITEAVKEVLRFGFEVKNFGRVTAITNAPNTASISVMEKAGMKFEKKDSFHEQDSVFYSITNESKIFSTDTD